MRKAELAIELTGLRLGIGSEGSFGAGPWGSLITWNTELIAWHDADRSWTIIGRAQGPSTARELEITSAAQADVFLSEVPAQQSLIVRSGPRIAKGLQRLPAASLIRDWLNAAPGQPLHLQYDLRAHHCPERRLRITQAAENLAERLCSCCPQCGRPDFSADQVEYGLPCRLCGTATGQIASRVAVCADCGNRQQYDVPERSAEPYYCEICHP